MLAAETLDAFLTYHLHNELTSIEEFPNIAVVSTNIPNLGILYSKNKFNASAFPNTVIDLSANIDIVSENDAWETER